MNRRDILKDIAGSSDRTPAPPPISASSQRVLRTIDDFKRDYKDVEPAKKYAKMFGLIEGLNISEDNRDFIYEELHSVHPISKEKSIEFVTNHYTTSINSFPKEEKLSYIQDNFYKFPSEMLQDVQDTFLGLRTHQAERDFEHARIALYKDVKNKIKSKDWSGLGADKPPRAYARQFLRVLDNDLIDLVGVHNGDICFSSEEGMTPSWVLRETQDLDSKFIYENDLLPLIEEEFKIHVERNRQRVVEEEKETIKSLYANLHDIPEDTRHNVILDHAFNSPDPVSIINESIQQSVSSAIKGKKIRTYKDIIRHWRIEHDKIQNTLMKRMNGYG